METYVVIADNTNEYAGPDRNYAFTLAAEFIHFGKNVRIQKWIGQKLIAVVGP